MMIQLKLPVSCTARIMRLSIMIIIIFCCSKNNAFGFSNRHHSPVILRYSNDKSTLLCTSHYIRHHNERIANTESVVIKRLSATTLRTRKTSTSAILMSKQQQDNGMNASSITFSSKLMVAAPLISIIFPILLTIAKSFPEGSSEQYIAIATLFATNRLYLYLLSTIILILASYRGSQDDPSLGQRVVGLTEELLYNPSLENRGQIIIDKNKDVKNSFENSPAMIQSLSTELGDNLDEVSTETQAIILPLLISALLASSVFFLQFYDGDLPMSSTGGSSDFDIAALLAQYLPQLSKLWNILILSLFTRCEVRRLIYELKLPIQQQEIMPWIIGVGVTSLAYSGIWPAQNFVNMALAGLVGRAIQITRFPAIVAALGLLTFYDAASVFLIKPAIAADIDTIISSSSTSVLNVADSTTGASSAMGAVAMNKLLSADFQPGLLVTRVGKSLGGALGLGDAVFPAILAIFVKRYDDAQSDAEKAFSLFGASVLGYVIGCLTCELLPFISTSGVPALLLIAPSMLLSVIGLAAIRGGVQELWDFNPNDSEII